MSKTNRMLLLSIASVFILTVVATQISNSPFYLANTYAANTGIGACPSLNSRLASNLVSVSTSTAGNTITYKFSSTDESPTAGVPGLIQYCVFADVDPTSTTSLVHGVDNVLWDNGISSGFFGYARHTGNSNLPLNGTQNVDIGTANFSTLPTSQTILLHINDAAECDRLYGGNPGTCWVLPGVISPKLGDISGMKFNDTNGNGVMNTGDNGLEGWTINITGPNSFSASAVTNSTGQYQFTGLQPGQYTITETAQSGWTQTAPGGGSFTVTIDTSGQVVTGQNFGNFKLGDISGMKFNDTNGNGVMNTGDNGLEGWTINITGPNSFSASAVTNSTGQYQFTGLQPGQYTITETAQSGWTQTAPGGGSFTVTIDTSGQVVTGQNFGNFNDGEIKVTKFYDANTNGIFDTGDTPITGWKVGIVGSLYQVLGLTPFDTTQILLPDTYTVSEYQSATGQWVNTTSKSYSVTIVEGSMQSKAFGNVCVGAGGGCKPIYWYSSTGQALITSGDLTMLRALNLKNANGTNFDPTTAAQVSTWLQTVSTANMANMLSAQLASMELSVAHKKVNPNSFVYAPGEKHANAAGFVTVKQLMSDANADLGLPGHNNTTQSGSVRTYQELMKTALYNANSNLNFAQSKPCKFSFP